MNRIDFEGELERPGTSGRSSGKGTAGEVGVPSVELAGHLLRSVWGHAEFRTGQRRAVLALLHGRDCLAILPTGAGKSLCFQLPALALPGMAVVVSPLISLMQDQVRALRTRGVPAAYISSTQSEATQDAVWDRALTGRLKLLYVSPERGRSLADRVARTAISLLAVDEAHCISEWGHDFRPHYRRLGTLRRELGFPPTIAVTGTATHQTQSDVVTLLALRRPVRVAGSFDRPNLAFIAQRVDAEAVRVRTAARLARTCGGSAIVYVPTRNRTDAVARAFRVWGVAAAPYHAGLPAGARRALLARFLDSRLRVIVATSAFGMGIDKGDVRAVVHLGVPARPEAYWQEAGRGGRDGLPARCTVLWRPGDLAFAAHLAKPNTGSAAHREAVERGLTTMERFLSTRGCRRRVLLSYLGERIRACGGCDRCGC